MKPAESGAENGEIRLSSTAIEQYLPATEMARLLELSDNELTRLARSAVLQRQRSGAASRLRLRNGHLMKFFTFDRNRTQAGSRFAGHESAW